MTLVKVKREFISGQSVVTQIEIKNHTGFDGKGYDIVCAAVSSSTELVINVLTEKFGCECEVKISDEPPEILFSIPKSEYFDSDSFHSTEDGSGNENHKKQKNQNEKKTFAVRGLLDGFVAHLENIAREYPKNVRVILA